MDFKLTTPDGLNASMSFEKAADITNNIFLSLNVQRGAFFQNPDFGSRLHLLKQMVLNNRTVKLSKEYAREALQWIIDTGRAKSIKVTAEKAKNDVHRLNMQIAVVQADGREIIFDTFVEVV